MRTCFIIAPADSDLSTLVKVLEQKGIHPVFARRIRPGYTIIDQVKVAISRADVVIAIIDRTNNADVFYELGIAHALFKRVLMFVSPSVDKLPSDISNMSYIRADATNREAISFAINSLIEAGQIGKFSHKSFISATKPLGNYATYLLSELNAPILQDERRMEDLVVSALGKSGISIIARSEDRGIGADLAVWVDDLAPLIGTPLLIEIKVEIRSIAHFNQIVEEVRGYLLESNSNLAIVLFNRSRVPNPPVSFPVLFLSLRELLERLRTESFATIITDIRNKLVHGA